MLGLHDYFEWKKARFLHAPSFVHLGKNRRHSDWVQEYCTFKRRCVCGAQGTPCSGGGSSWLNRREHRRRDVHAQAGGTRTGGGQRGGGGQRLATPVQDLMIIDRLPSHFRFRTKCTVMRVTASTRRIGQSLRLATAFPTNSVRLPATPAPGATPGFRSARTASSTTTSPSLWCCVVLLMAPRLSAPRLLPLEVHRRPRQTTTHTHAVAPD